MLGFAPLADNSIAGFGNIPADVAVTGVSGTSAVGSVLVWGQIIPSQSSGFSAITPSQSPNWEEIAA